MWSLYKLLLQISMDFLKLCIPVLDIMKVCGFFLMETDLILKELQPFKLSPFLVCRL